MSISSTLKVPELFLSVTFLALSISLPELITMITSLMQKRENLTIGNLVGSSVLHLTLGVGLATIFYQTTVPSPANYLIFIPMVMMGIISLFALWNKISLKIIGGLLLLSTLITLLVFFLH
jgi:cation:H+ antiporter